MTGYGLIAGMTLHEVLITEPGFVIDLYVMRRKYDDEQHFIKRKRAAEWSD